MLLAIGLPPIARNNAFSSKRLSNPAIASDIPKPSAMEIIVISILSSQTGVANTTTAALS